MSGMADNRREEEGKEKVEEKEIEGKGYIHICIGKRWKSYNREEGELGKGYKEERECKVDGQREGEEKEER